METIIKKQANGYNVLFDGKDLIVNGKKVYVNDLAEFNKLHSSSSRMYTENLTQEKIDTLCLFGIGSFVAIRNIDNALERITEIQKEQEYKPEVKGAGWCERCESYCFGDCQAN